MESKGCRCKNCPEKDGSGPCACCESSRLELKSTLCSSCGLVESISGTDICEDCESAILKSCYEFCASFSRPEELDFETAAALFSEDYSKPENIAEELLIELVASDNNYDNFYQNDEVSFDERNAAYRRMNEAWKAVRAWYRDRGR